MNALNRSQLPFIVSCVLVVFALSVGTGTYIGRFVIQPEPPECPHVAFRELLHSIAQNGSMAPELAPAVSKSLELLGLQDPRDENTQGKIKHHFRTLESLPLKSYLIRYYRKDLVTVSTTESSGHKDSFILKRIDSKWSLEMWLNERNLIPAGFDGPEARDETSELKF